MQTERLSPKTITLLKRKDRIYLFFTQIFVEALLQEPQTENKLPNLQNLIFLTQSHKGKQPFNIQHFMHSTTPIQTSFS